MQTPTTVHGPERLTLYYRQGSSDKVYQCSIEPEGEGFVVNFAFGRRGSTLQTGTKTSAPVNYDAAKLIFNKLVREKTTKGYTPGEDGVPYSHCSCEHQTSGILPQLLNPIQDEELHALLEDTLWCLQEKMDGKRLLLRKAGEKIEGINRKGLLVGLPASLAGSAQNIAEDFLLDGECVGDVLHVFDVLGRGEEMLLGQPYQSRWHSLVDLLDYSEHPHIQLVETAFDTPEKKLFFDMWRKERREGVVFKRLDAPYTPGRPNSGGTQLKYKFYASLSAVVERNNEQRSVEMRLFAGDSWKSAGNVTIPPNQPIPSPGRVVEVRYLYAFPESGVLYQPVYVGLRSDVAALECTTAQLKFRRGDGEEEL